VGAIGSGSAKLILFGEHSAVHGHPAVGISLPERTVVELTSEGREEWGLDGVPPEDRRTAARILALLEKVLPGPGARGRGAVRISSTVPRGLGFGSSAALCAAFAGALAAHASSQAAGAAPAGTSPERIWALAHEAERLFHGTPSGIDTGLSILGGLRGFSPHPPGLPYHESLGGIALFLVVGALPRVGNCGALVAAIGQRMKEGDTATRDSIARLGAIAAEAREELRRAGPSGPARLGGLAVRAMDRLRSLGLSTKGMDLLMEEGERAGALGGKLSGAGGGGAFFLLMADTESAEEAAARLIRTAAARGVSFVAAPRVVAVAGN
jgi:mevalonate kinase